MSFIAKKNIFEDPEILKVNDNDSFKYNWNSFENDQILQDLLNKIHRHKFYMIFSPRFGVHYLRKQ